MKLIQIKIRNLGLTLPEVLLGIAILLILVSLSIPSVGGGPTKHELAQAVSNARQLHIATTGAAADGLAQEDTSIGWPADIQPHPANTGQFIKTLMDGGYLKFGDLKVLGAGSMVIKDSQKFEAATDCGFKVYNVSNSDTTDTIFLTSKNVIIEDDTARWDPRYRNQFKSSKSAFVVFRRGGDGTYILKLDPAKAYGTLPQTIPAILPPGGVIENPKSRNSN